MVVCRSNMPVVVLGRVQTGLTESTGVTRDKTPKNRPTDIIERVA